MLMLAVTEKPGKEKINIYEKGPLPILHVSPQREPQRP